MLLRHIRYFLAVAEHRNFTRAAEALYVSQPTLSQQIKQLEDTLGAPLFDRSGRVLQLTDAGEAYRHYAQRALQDLDAGVRAIHDVQSLTRGNLRLAVTPTFTPYLIGPLVAQFHARYPHITLNIQEMTQERMEHALNADALEVGIAFERAQSADIEDAALLVEDLTLVVGSAHPYAGRQQALPLCDFAQAALALLNDAFATRQHIDRYFRQHGLMPRIAIEADSVSAIIEIVRHSALATLLPAAVVGEGSGLHPVTLAPPPPSRMAVLLQRRGAYRTAAARAFVDLALAAFTVA